MKTTISVILMILMNFFNVNYQEKSDPVAQWLKSNGCKVERLELNDAQQDLQILDKIVGEAKVVCLGESRHDAREQFLLKHRLIKYLVEEMGFNTFVLEASFPYAEQINTFILHNEGNLEEIMAGMPGWFIWDTKEMHDIIEWMREYNSNPENSEKIRFYGIDIVAPDYGLTEIFNYIRELDRDTYESLQNKSFGREFIDDGFWPNTRREYAGLSNEQKQDLAINYSELYSSIQTHKTEYISRSSKNEYEWILRLSYCAQMATEMFSAESRMEMGLTRDQTMAKNVFWIREQLPESKMIVWAHNVHIATSEFTMSMEEGSIKGMGSIMKDELGDDMVSIGAAFNQGFFEEGQRTSQPAGSNTIDAALSMTGFEYAIFDLHAEAGDEIINEWLNSPHVLQAQDFEMTCVPIEAYDAFYFTESISKTRLNQSSAARLGNMR